MHLRALFTQRSPRKLDGCWDRPGRFYLAARPQSRILETLSTDKLASLTEAELLNFARSRHIPLCPMDVSTLTCKARRYVEKPSVATRRCRAFALTLPFFQDQQMRRGHDISCVPTSCLSRRCVSIDELSHPRLCLFEAIRYHDGISLLRKAF